MNKADVSRTDAETADESGTDVDASCTEWSFRHTRPLPTTDAVFKLMVCHLTLLGIIFRPYCPGKLALVLVNEPQFTFNTSYAC